MDSFISRYPGFLGDSRRLVAVRNGIDFREFGFVAKEIINKIHQYYYERAEFAKVLLPQHVKLMEVAEKLVHKTTDASANVEQLSSIYKILVAEIIKANTEKCEGDNKCQTTS